VERATRSVAYALAEDILEPHSARRPVATDWTCGGQAYAFIEYPHQLELKRAVICDAFARLGRMPVVNPVTMATDMIITSKPNAMPNTAMDTID
jgi:tRNA/tmRNA/rRNA uracil-C5-methylase (TrmA/RlmC/RlmD family)